MHRTPHRPGAHNAAHLPARDGYGGGERPRGRRVGGRWAESCLRSWQLLPIRVAAPPWVH